MDYRPLGRTGISVSAFSLGAMAFGAIGNTDHDECERMVAVALDAGINTVDTADIYSRGESEEIVGKALAGRRDDVVLTTKCYWPMTGEPNHRGLSRRWITRSVDQSLRRLRTDWIDIFFLHKPDATTDLDESLGAVSDLIHQGKIRTFGTSSFPGHMVVEAQWVADRRSRERPRVEQLAYSILARGVEGDVLPLCQRHGIGVMVAAPLTAGWLTGKYRPGAPIDPSTRAGKGTNPAFRQGPTYERKQAVVEELVAVADGAGCSLMALALAFAIEHPAISTAILGPRTMTQLDDLLKCVDTRLSADVLDRIDEIVAPGVDVDPADRWYVSPALDVNARRR